MKLIETTVTETSVWMRYADDADPTKANQWIDFQVPVADLELPKKSGGMEPLGDPELRLFAEVRAAALRYAREAITAEAKRRFKYDEGS